MSRFVQCPICNCAVAMTLMGMHLDTKCCSKGGDGVEDITTPAATTTTTYTSPEKHKLDIDINTNNDNDDNDNDNNTSPTQNKFDNAAIAINHKRLRTFSIAVPAQIADDKPEIDVIPYQTSSSLSGHLLIFDFISEDEELELLEALEACEPDWMPTHRNGPHNIKGWGANIDLYKREVPIPECLGFVSSRIAKLPMFASRKWWPAEVNANEYTKALGHRLGAHMDDRYRYGDTIAMLSLSSSCRMAFAKEKGISHATKVHLPRRSLQVITGLARYAYTHGIENEDIDEVRRVSVTFRMDKSLK